jgi:GT2 family glycosyltransferase
MSKGDIICIHDADVTTPPNLLSLLDELKDNVASVGPALLTYKEASFLNRLYYYWEKTRKFAPLGEEPRGALRLVKRECLVEVGGFKDVIAQDTQLDIDLRNAGYKSKVVTSITYYHLRKFSFRKAIGSQIQAGKMRRQMKMPFWRVFGHAIIRLRPFVVYGYLFKREEDNRSGSCHR